MVERYRKGRGGPRRDRRPSYYDGNMLLEMDASIVEPVADLLDEVVSGSMSIQSRHLTSPDSEYCVKERRTGFYHVRRLG